MANQIVYGRGGTVELQYDIRILLERLCPQARESWRLGKEIYRDSKSRPNVSEGYEVISELPGRPVQYQNCAFPAR